MDDKHFAAVVSRIEATGLPIKTYPNQYLINVTDVNGVVQSYYASTGTAVFRDSNDKYNSKKHTEKNLSNRRFVSLCTGEEDILKTFF